MKKTSKNTEGRGGAIVLKGRGEGRGRMTNTFFFVFLKQVNSWVASQEALV